MARRILSSGCLLANVLAADARLFTPSKVAVGTAPRQATGPFAAFTLNGSHPLATLDYGVEVAGYPRFTVSEISGAAAVQVEVKYSEPFAALEHVWSDGPYPYQQGLANAFRVETFNISAAGSVASGLIQGGQRWQSIRLLDARADVGVTFQSVGFEATAGGTEIAEMPGRFSCDDEVLNEVWALGARAADLACVESGTQKAVWQVDAEKGVRVASIRPTQTLRAGLWGNYTLEFDTMIERGGVWWSVAWPLGRFGGVQLQLTSELPNATTFSNTNTTLTPRNTLKLGWGYGFVNQTTLTSYDLDISRVPFDVAENKWYHVTTVLSPDGFLAVSLDKTQILATHVSKYYIGGGPLTLTGSFGFGAWQDQAAWVRNVTATAQNGTVVYRNPMTSSDVLAEYGVETNAEGVCLDGPKRDRLVWLGDFLHTIRIMGASTSRFDLERGTLRFLLRTQIPLGILDISPRMGYDPASASGPFTAFGAQPYGLEDYQLLGMGSLYSYLEQTGDVAFVRDSWAQWQLQFDWLLSRVNQTTKLLNFGSAFLGPAVDGSATSCLAVQTLLEIAHISKAVGDAAYQAKAARAADEITRAVNAQLWNDARGFYSLSLADKDDLSVQATAFCLSSGVASDPRRISRSVAALAALELGPAYKDSSLVDSTAADTNISPNTNGFLLDGLLRVVSSSSSSSRSNGTTTATATATKLLRSLWPRMLSRAHADRHASGASWEYLTPAGEPGLSLFTSLAHPWGGAATYALTRHAAGIRQADGVEGFGYRSWVVDPEVGVGGLGLKRVSAQVQTPRGPLAVDWTIGPDSSGRDVVNVLIRAPAGTRGVFRYKDTTQVLEGAGEYTLAVPV
ncbi:uncharacterized protein PpBr36_06749 [Pyricularia pennisetigena]|uniref:uncharacterized protein n=1 Tax=Pyricularia pennisetigena TaxID=1578925 RepID=UPI0011528754|nr:uncharacterized protein PpBr36_06749 [Pyricularia pennisetigena]TLS22618.1 hypothetical protein PpBr36_06749 [Pyricularia pennisetigena]